MENSNSHEIIVNNEIDDKPDCICFKTKNCCTRKVIKYNCLKCLGYCMLSLIFILIVASVVCEAIVYLNDSYEKIEQLILIVLVTMFIESVVITPIVISVCEKKPIWPVIIANVIFVVIQLCLFLGVLSNK